MKTYYHRMQINGFDRAVGTSETLEADKFSLRKLIAVVYSQQYKEGEYCTRLVSLYTLILGYTHLV